LLLTFIAEFAFRVWREIGTDQNKSKLINEESLEVTNLKLEIGSKPTTEKDHFKVPNFILLFFLNFHE
jgi:hypothetical protein